MMPMQMTMDYSGPGRRDRGIARAAEHAEAEAPGWSGCALDMLRRYVREIGGEFMAEQFREWAHGQGLEDPPSRRAFGAVIVRAKNTGLIRFVGYRNVANPRAHATPASVWRAA